MARPKRDPAATSREEDFRDYEERETDEGWPYADQDAVKTGETPDTVRPRAISTGRKVRARRSPTRQ